MSDTGIIELEDRVAELERELRQRDDKIKELRTELAEAQELVNDMREQVEDTRSLIERWREVFEMQQDDNGVWIFDRDQSELWRSHLDLRDRHQKLIREWNKMVTKYNAVVAPREIGRPIAASEPQQAEVRKRHKVGESLRAIASTTGLSLRTVRTVTGKGKAAKRRNEIRRKEFDKLRAASFRARNAARERLPAQIAEVEKTGEALVKAAKGLGRL